MKTARSCKHLLAHLAVVLALIALCSCRTAYRIDTPDYDSPQTPAAILISDPQVFERASLINDRRRELDYLQRLLENSAVDSVGKSVVTFPPQILQDLHTIETLSVALGLSVGKTVPAKTGVSDIVAQIEVAKLEAQLAILRKQIEGIAAAAIPEVTIPAPEVGSAAEAAQSTPTTLLPDVSALQAAIKEIQGKLTSLSSPGAPTAPSDSYGHLVDARNDFSDRQAYRRDLRAALAEAQLDDIHDRGGNALYRLQFQATVLPRGVDTKQWAAAKMKIEPPTLNAQDVAAAYYGWLAFISRRLTAELRANAEITASHERFYYLHRFYSDLGWSGYFNVIDLLFDGERYACFNHGTADESLLYLLQNDYRLQGTFVVPPAMDWSATCAAYPASFKSITFNALPPDKADQVLKLLRLMGHQRELRFMPVVPNPRPLPSPTPQPQPLPSPERLSIVPKDFCRSVVDAAEAEAFCADLDKANGSSKLVKARGGSSDPQKDPRGYSVRSYSVLPIELEQRLGVTAESSQSLQTALSVAAQVSAASTAGIDAGYLAQTNARAQALAREPLVVGFGGSDCNRACIGGSNCAVSCNGFFGWLFGPEFGFKNAKTLSLRQMVRSYGLTVDVSFPGWWDYVRISIETEWIKSWQAPQLMEASSRSVTKVVRLPLSDAAYESLSNYIAAQQYGAQTATISVSYVTPNLIPTCASTVTYQIGGSNLWRADAIHLAGVKAKSIAVLPDMKGVAAEFDMNAVYGNLSNSPQTVQAIPLVVSSQQGSARSAFVWLIGSRQSTNGVTTCQSPIILPTNVSAVAATVTSFTPLEVCSDAKLIPLIVRGVNLPDKVVVHSDIVEASYIDPRDEWEGDWLQRQVDLKVLKDEKLKLGALPMTLTYSEGLGSEKGSFEIAMKVKDCAAAEQKAVTVTAEKAQLITSSVKLAKDQTVTVKAPIPASYADVVIAVRRKTTTNDAKWLESASATPDPGNSSEVSGVLDLSKSDAKPGDKLEVEVRVRARPGVAWQSNLTETTLVVAPSP